MAEFPLTTQDRSTLVDIIARYAELWDTPRRLNFLENCGLDKFKTKVKHEGSSEGFAQELVRVLQNRGTLIETGEPALASVLRHLVKDVVAGQETERQFIEQLLGKFSPRIPRVESLPTRTPIFIGQEDLIERVITTITEGKVAHLWGMGGIGKTEIALQVAKRLSLDYSDAALIVELQPDNIPAGSDAILRQIISKLNPSTPIPQTSEELSALAHQLMANKRGILILDNAAGYAQFKQWASAWQGWGVIITSRIRFPIPLPLGFEEITSLDEDESVLLLRALLSHYQRTETEEDLKRLARECHNLPLALNVAAAFLTTYSDWNVNDYVIALSSQPFKMLEAPDYKSVSKILGFSFTRLLEDQPEIAQCWQLLAEMPAPFDKELASGVLGTLDVSGVSPIVLHLLDSKIRNILSELTRRSLLSYNRQTELYYFHDLLKTYALDTSLSRSSKELIDQTVYCHAITVLNRGMTANDLYNKGEQLLALKEFDLIWDHLDYAWQNQIIDENYISLYFINSFAGWMSSLISLRVKASQRIKYMIAGLEASKKLDDTSMQSMHLSNLGIVYFDLDNYDQAIIYSSDALNISITNNDETSLVASLSTLGNSYLRLGELDSAVDFHKKALAISTMRRDNHAIGNQLGNLANAYDKKRDYQTASEYIHQALDIARTIGDKRGEGNRLSTLSRLYVNLDRLGLAIDYCNKSIKIADELGDKRGKANRLNTLAGIYTKMGDIDSGLTYYDMALSIARDIGDIRNEGIILGNMGSIKFDFEYYEEAKSLYQQALSISEQIGERFNQGSWCYNLARVYKRTGQEEKAVFYLRKALALSQNNEAPEVDLLRKIIEKM